MTVLFREHCALLEEMTPGTKLGSYQILSAFGAGKMGGGYRYTGRGAKGYPEQGGLVPRVLRYSH